MKPVAPDPDLIAWLWSEEGLAWLERHVRRVSFQNAAFAEVKDDHECTAYCGVYREELYNDRVIRRDMKHYGLSGVPEEWKQRFES